MSTERAVTDTWTVPTEMSRSDGIADLMAMLGSALLAFWLVLHGVPILALAPVVALVAIFVLTGEPAGDVRGIGALAAGLRSKLGLRRAHEWLFAWWHFFIVRQWPDFKEAVDARSRRLLMVLTRVRWIGRTLDWTLSTMRRGRTRLRLPLWLSRRVRSRVAHVPQV